MKHTQYNSSILNYQLHWDAQSSLIMADHLHHHFQNIVFVEPHRKLRK